MAAGAEEVICIASVSHTAQRSVNRRRYLLSDECTSKKIVAAGERHGIDFSAHPHGHIYAIARVVPSFQYDDTSLLTEEQRLQYTCWARLLGGDLQGKAYFFSVVEVVLLRPPVENVKWTTCGVTSYFTPLEGHMLGRIFDTLVEDPGGVPDWVADNSMAVVHLPHPWALLVANGIWRSFSICDLGRGSGGRRVGWRLQMGATKRHLFSEARWTYRHAPSDQVASINVYSPTAMNGFADALRELLAFAADNGVEPPRLEQTHVMLAAMQRASDDLELMLDADVLDESRHRNTAPYNVTLLVRCFLLCGLLRADSKLREAIVMAVRIVCPQGIADLIVDAIERGVRNLRLPSASTISRARARIDVSWMMVWRDRIRQWLLRGVTVHVGTDSSPQSGRDYQVVLLIFVLHEHLLRMFEAWSDLMSMQLAGRTLC